MLCDLCWYPLDIEKVEAVDDLWSELDRKYLEELVCGFPKYVCEKEQEIC